MTIQDTHKKRNATLICMKCKLNAVCEYKMNVIHSSMNLRPCLDWRSLNYAQIVWTILQFHRSMNSWQWKLLVVWARAKRVVRAKRHKHLSMRFSLSPSPSYSNTHTHRLSLKHSPTAWNTDEPLRYGVNETARVIERRCSHSVQLRRLQFYHPPTSSAQCTNNTELNKVEHKERSDLMIIILFPAVKNGIIYLLLKIHRVKNIVCMRSVKSKLSRALTVYHCTNCMNAQAIVFLLIFHLVSKLFGMRMQTNNTNLLLCIFLFLSVYLPCSYFIYICRCFFLCLYSRQGLGVCFNFDNPF